MLKTCLEDQGFRITTALGGCEALERLQSGEPFDLVVSDLSMPDVDGLDVLRAARARQPGLSAILLTGYAGDVQALELEVKLGGGISFLRKPVSGADLIACIRRLERRQICA
jgi:CheY-like chemotaxis protein